MNDNKMNDKAYLHSLRSVRRYLRVQAVRRQQSSRRNENYKSEAMNYNAYKPYPDEVKNNILNYLSADTSPNNTVGCSVDVITDKMANLTLEDKMEPEEVIVWKGHYIVCE